MPNLSNRFTNANFYSAPATDFVASRFGSKKVPEIPPPLRNSPLMRRGGFDVFSGIADEYIKNSLLAEAVAQRRVMTESLVTEADTEEIRGGAPRRKFLSSAGGEFQRAFYQSQWLIDFLRGLTTPLLRPTGEYGTYSHYSRTGDFLEIHRDIAVCDVAVITCLHNSFGVDKNRRQIVPVSVKNARITVGYSRRAGSRRM